MKVALLNSTINPELLIATAAKLCYSPSSIEELKKKQTEEGIEKFLNMLMSYGHQSPIEHVSFTFAVEGVSRSLSHQLVRHRIASYSQQSQRYVKLNQFDYIVPPAINNNEKCKEIYVNAMKNIQRDYNIITDYLIKGYLEQGLDKKVAEKKAIEDARYLFPNACETKIILTMNARSLMNFFNHRCCNRAQWEIKALANEMLKQVKKVAPTLFKNAGAPCRKGYCPEGKMQCQEFLGKIPVR